jgi:hypothetical protein
MSLSAMARNRCRRTGMNVPNNCFEFARVAQTTWSLSAKEAQQRA